MRHLLSLFCALAVAFSLLIVPARAVTPADPLIASAMYSFLVSAGIKLWRDGIEGSEDAIDNMVSDMQAVWGYYKEEKGANVPSWSNIAGITTNNGQIVLSYDTAQTFQGFADWLAEYKEMTPGNTYNLSSGPSSSTGWTLFTLPANETTGLNYLNNGVWALPANSGSGVTAEYSAVSEDNINYRTETSTSSSGQCFIVEISDRYYCYFCSTSEFTINKTIYYPNSPDLSSNNIQEVNTTYQLNGISRPNDGTRYFFYMSGPTTYRKNNFDLSGPVNFATTAAGNDVAIEIAYVILAGDPVGTAADLFATVGWTVASKVRDLLQDQSLAIDIGASAGADEEEIIGTAALGYSVPATSEVVPSAVATPVPIAGVSELYPQAEAAVDVDSLGLPALGQALTTRFPFCIPWDVVYLYQSLNATPIRPVIEIDVLPAAFKQKIGITADTSFTFDLGDPQYATAVKIVRWATLFGFVLGLAFVTKRLIWPTGG